ncbi:cytochrome P450 [Mycobacterium sp. shizuoka-1]|uniref:cytochrome P450 n=1 Tax=Mycobacterium sp. shizuoka-1 TaxID=2039281 RepID=UPI000C05E1FD|nr:cytochrome P450 [Mycobacterium sp. shizuoka-1]GAY17507.1 putative cytochrome P450 128 [Mycobacterium sp. shizuoka-1]
MPADLRKPAPRAVASVARASVTDLWRPVATGAYRDLRRPRPGTLRCDLPRSTFDPTLPANIVDPYPALERLREHPVVVNERLGVWMLARYEDVHAAARNGEVLSSRDGIMLRSVAASAVLTVDPPDHTRLRHIAAPVFTKRAVKEWTSDIERLADESISALRDGKTVDLVSTLTVPMPINVIATILGVPRAQWPAFRAVSERIAQAFAPRTLPEVMRMVASLLQSYVQLRSFVTVEMARRATAPADDLLTRLHTARSAGELTDTEAFFYSTILLVAGNETTTNLLGMLLMRLAQDPELFDALKADRALVPNAVEETARWGSPVQWVTRVATAPYEVGGTVIPAGGKVVLFYASANRDPAKFAEPDRLDITRDTTGHLSFGHGLHFCLGAHLARLETITAVNHLLDQIDGLELAGPVRWGTTPSLQGPASLPVRIRSRG